MSLNTGLLRRYVPGPNIDEPILWYEGSGTSDRRWFHADERGSIVAVSDSSGNLVGSINRYDEYGNPQGTLTGRFGFTGQLWMPELGLYHYRARAYDPALGRFMQADPIGYGDGMNLYAYVNGDPLNFNDPAGTCAGGRICGKRRDDAEAALKRALAGIGRSARDLFGDDLLEFADGAIGEYALAVFYQTSGQLNSMLVGAAGFGGTMYVPSWQARSLREAFLDATFVGSAAKALDPNVAFATNPIVFQNAVRFGTMFLLTSDSYLLGTLLLQARISYGSRVGIVEYMMPRNFGYLLGNPIITHARFIPGAPISGYPNNFYGRRHGPFGVI